MPQQSFDIQYTKDALKALQRMDGNLRNRVRAAILGLTKVPPEGDIKPLQGKQHGMFRLRVGGYRVIYCYRDGGEITVLCVLNIGSRGDIYK